jgi:hypothetical protein
VTVVVKGTRPPSDEPAKQEYLRKKLSELRKNCLWLAAGGASAEVFGSLLKDIGRTAPTWLRVAVFTVAGFQILVALVGGFSWNAREIDNALVTSTLILRFNARRRLRNISAALLLIIFVLIVILNLKYPAT